MTDLVRVGEGHYSGPPPKPTLERRLAVAKVLREMRQVTSRMIIGKGEDECLT